MQEHLTWLTHQLATAGDSLASSQWHAEELRLARQAISPVWSDLCAQQMTQRYLSPHQQASEAAHQALQNHLHHLRQLHGMAAEGLQRYLQVQQLSNEIDLYLQECSTLFRTLDSLLSQTNQGLSKLAEHHQVMMQKLRAADKALDD